MAICKACGRTLKRPVSIQRGYGPACWRKRQSRKPDRQRRLTFRD